MIRMAMSYQDVSGIGPFQLLENFRCFCGSVYQHAISGLGTGNYVAISVAVRIAGSTEGSQRTPIDLHVLIFCYTRHFYSCPFIFPAMSAALLPPKAKAFDITVSTVTPLRPIFGT